MALFKRQSDHGAGIKQKASRHWLLVTFVLLVTLTACAAGPNPEVHTAAANGVAAGFWVGIWQGIISPFAFLISLFNANVNVYEVHNSGGWYNAGFLLGAVGVIGGIVRGISAAITGG
jgi:hypothetical protein